MSNQKSLLGSGWAMVTHNKRYIFWLWWLNLTLAEFGTASFRKSAHAILDHSMVADRLLHGFDLMVLTNLLARPEFGPMSASTAPALYFSFLFLIFTALFLPGVFQGYASTYRLPREDFFRACGRSLWRYLRLMLIAGLVMGIVAGVLFAINGAIVKKAGDSSNEVLPFELQMAGLALIFLVMTTLRIWFDLAEVDVVLSDQRAVRKSLWTGLRHTLRSLLRLLASYVVATLLAAIILVGGILVWMKFIAPENWLGAYVVSQLTLLLLLIPRFWQRGVAVTYWQQSMIAPVVAPAPVIAAFTPVAVPVPPATPPSPAPEGA